MLPLAGQNVFPCSTVGERPCWQLSSAPERSSRFLSWASIPIMVESLSMKKSLPFVCVSRLPLREDAPMRNGISASWSRKMGSWCERLVGHARLIGEHAYRQLDEFYRALHWYVNCFQPSMKLVSKQVEGRKIRRIYDAAKTPREPRAAL